MSGMAESWYRVAELTPRLRTHAALHRHCYRGRVWFVLQDGQTGRHFRISPAANALLCLMDGRRTADRIWTLAGERMREERPSRGDLVELLVQLHGADLLQAGLPPDMTELERRAARDRRGRTLAWLRNPMALRIPLLDPDRMLARLAPLVAWVPWRLALVAWVLLVGSGLAVAVARWPELTAGISDRALSARNLLLAALVYPVAKALHELGHALATRLGGGEVHEVGVMLLVLVPVPYVDASASIAFRSKGARMAVAAAGVMVELALAAVAVWAWAVLEPGLLRAAAWSLALLCSVSTLLFNANPLLRFDGYYVLADLLEIPNLDTRSRRYLLYILKRWVLGMADDVSPVQASGERFWFVAYGLSAFAYRLVVMAGVAVLVASKLFVVGVALAALSVVQMVVLPVVAAVRFLLSGRALRRRRRRALAAAGGLLAAALVLLFVVPMPYALVEDGVVWVPDEATVRAGASGFADAPLVAPGAEVTLGTVLLHLRDPVADAQVDVFRAQLRVAEGRWNETNLLDRAQAQIAGTQLTRARGNLLRMEQRSGDLEVVANRAGRFVAVSDAESIAGRFFRKGDLIGYVLGDDDRDVRVVAPQADLDLLRGRARAVTVRYADAAGQPVVAASVVRWTPSALDRAPAPGLGSGGGGPMVADPASPDHERALERFFAVDLRAGRPAARIGGHVLAKFELPAEPVAWRVLRAVRQLTLRAFDA